VWWENGTHNYKATHLGRYVTGLGLSLLFITQLTRLKDFRSTASDTTIQRPQQSSSNLFPSSLFCFLVSSQSTISLRLLPPYTPRNETSIFVASYGSCSAISWPGISAPNGALTRRSFLKIEYGKVSWQRETDDSATIRKWVKLTQRDWKSGLRAETTPQQQLNTDHARRTTRQRQIDD